MDILFVNCTTELSLRREINGTLLLATKLLQDGFDTDVLRLGQIPSYEGDYLTFIADITQAVLDRNAKCVSFYTLWPFHHIMLRIAREVKQRSPETVIVFGGPQASCTARATLEFMPYVDFVNTGEGENTVVPLFRCILRGEGDLSDVPGLHYRKEGKLCQNDQPVPLSDLDELPMWDPRLLLPQSPEELARKDYFMPIDVGRGCPYSCTFCCTSFFWRRVYRLKSPERIVAEIRYLHDTYGITSFMFSHDAFTINKKLVEQVCDKILESGLKITWRCSARLDCITEDLILKMQQAGMVHLELGVETGSPRMQKIINKNLDLDKARKVVSFLLERKLRVGLFFMYGFPQETEEDLNQTIEVACFFHEQGVSYESMFFCKFCPQTALMEEFGEQLVFDRSARMNFLNVYGLEHELDVISANREIFPFYFHLKTPLREDYAYMHYFMELYRAFPNTIWTLRKLYKGDNLKFYRDFVRANAQWFEGDLDALEKQIQENPLEMLLNLTATLELPKIRQLEGLLKLSYRVRTISAGKEDAELRDTYSFNYVDYTLKRPIEEYSGGSSELLISKKDGKLSVKVLNINWE